MMLYPVDYVEPEPVPRVVTGRDFEHALSLIRAAVPLEGPPLEMWKLVAIICGYTPTQINDTITVDDNPGQVLMVARNNVPRVQIIASEKTNHIRRHEAIELVKQVIEERRDSWTMWGGQ